MKPIPQSSWMISPKRFVKLLGVEYEMINTEDSAILVKFYLAAVAIVITVLISFASIWYAIDLLFRNVVTEIFLSVFFSLLFACIYIFLINTFSKEIVQLRNRFFNASNLIRISFVIFIAYLLAQPLCILIAGHKIQEGTDQHKRQVLDEHLETVRNFYSQDLAKLGDRKLYCIEQGKQFGTHHFDRELVQIKADIALINSKVSKMEADAIRKINNSSFFLYQIQLETRYISSWLTTIFIIALFLVPGYLVYSISADNAYYTLKKNYEKTMIVTAYGSFTQKYKQLFLTKYGTGVGIFSRFDDLPFKLKRKPAPTFGTIDAFLKKYITDEDRNELQR